MKEYLVDVRSLTPIYVNAESDKEALSKAEAEWNRMLNRIGNWSPKPVDPEFEIYESCEIEEETS